MLVRLDALPEGVGILDDLLRMQSVLIDHFIALTHELDKRILFEKLAVGLRKQ